MIKSMVLGGFLKYKMNEYENCYDDDNLVDLFVYVKYILNELTETALTYLI